MPKLRESLTSTTGSPCATQVRMISTERSVEPSSTRTSSYGTPASTALSRRCSSGRPSSSPGPESLPRERRDQAALSERGRAVLTSALEPALIDRTLAALAPLAGAGKLGPVLLQLTPAFGPGDHALAELEPLAARLKDHGLA